MRQHEIAEPEERSAPRRVIALEKIMRELESIENGLGHALSGLGGSTAARNFRPPDHRAAISASASIFSAAATES